MDKSFYYVVNRVDATRLKAALAGLGVPFETEPRGGRIVFFFPDLPVRQYATIRKLFGGDGLLFKG